MDWRIEWRKLAGIVAVFAAFFWLPVGWGPFDNAIMEALHLAKWYAREHVLLCLVPAFFIAGAIGVFVSQASVMKYLGAGANKILAYGVASTSGTILAVCSCTVLPLFAGIWRMGAGLGPACAFLYSGPAINILAIILTARILGLELGIARAVGAIGFSVIIGLLMHLIYRKEEQAKVEAQMAMPEPQVARPLWQNALFFAVMIGILVFANWGRPQAQEGFWFLVWSWKWALTSAFGLGFAAILVAWFDLPLRRVAGVGLATLLTWVLSRFWLVPAWGHLLGSTENPLPWEALIPFAVASVGLSFILSTGERSDELDDWFSQSWGFAKQIAPLLLAGVLVAGFLLGRPEHEGLIPNAWVATLVGGNSLAANFFAAISGAFMYFATLTEVPILQGLIGSGMGKGPALALLLAGPSLSLPSIIVITRIIGLKKGGAYISLVVLMSTLAGAVYGAVA